MTSMKKNMLVFVVSAVLAAAVDFFSFFVLVEDEDVVWLWSFFALVEDEDVVPLLSLLSLSFAGTDLAGILSAWIASCKSLL